METIAKADLETRLDSRSAELEGERAAVLAEQEREVEERMLRLRVQVEAEVAERYRERRERLEQRLEEVTSLKGHAQRPV